MNAVTLASAFLLLALTLLTVRADDGLDIFDDWVEMGDFSDQVEDIEDRRLRPKYCRLQKIRGPCEENIKRWYYNRNQGRCMMFTYGGCEGNKNNFETKQECTEACKRRQPKSLVDLFV